MMRKNGFFSTWGLCLGSTGVFQGEKIAGLKGETLGMIAVFFFAWQVVSLRRAGGLDIRVLYIYIVVTWNIYIYIYGMMCNLG